MQNALKKQVEELSGQVAQQVAQIKRLHAQNHELTVQNRFLNQKVQTLLARLFGSKSEKINPDQLQLLMSLGDLEKPTSDPDDNPPGPSPSKSKRTKRKHKPRIPENLPTEDIYLDPEEVKHSPADYKRIGEEVTQELDVIPPQYIRRRIIRGKYIKQNDQEATPIIAPLPDRLIEGSYASAGLITDIVIKKYQDHLPLYRQEQILKNRYGIDLTRQTMADWVASAADWLSPIYRLLKTRLQSCSYLQVDETPVKYCNKDGPPGGSKGYFWVYHDPWEKEIVYEWHTGRASTCLDEMLKSFKGVVQSDGYSAYPAYKRDREDIELACCWAHVRRKFFEARGEAPGAAGWFLKQIQALYQIEADLRNAAADPESRKITRKRDSLWRVRLIHKALQKKVAAWLPKSKMGEAVHYALARWKELENYCHNGLLEIDNNLVENAIRPTAVGKKNWLFIGHPQAGHRSAIIYTIIENCKQQGIDPQTYICDVLSRLPSMKITEVEQLLPSNWLKARQDQVA